MWKNKKVLMVHNYYQLAGGEDTVVANEKRMLEEHGHQVFLYSRNNSELKEMRKIQKLLLPFTTIFNVRTYREIRRIVKQQRIDIVHVHNTLALVSPSVYYAARSCKVPIVQTIHNFRMLCPGAVFYRDGHVCEDCVEHGLGCAVKYGCYRGSKAQTLLCVLSTLFHRMTGIYRKINYICLTEFNKKKLLMLNRSGRKIVDPDKIFVKPNFAYQGTMHKSDDYYLYIGRIEEIKGVKILLDAFKELPEFTLKMAGAGPELENFRAYAKEMPNVQFLGRLNRGELNEALSRAKAVIVTSQIYETFGMMIAEAYAAHVPVISGDIGNIGILVEEGKTGYKFAYNSSKGLVEAVHKMEESDREQLGENAYAVWKEKFAPERNYQLLMRVYEKIAVGE